MSSRFHPQLINDPFGDPGLYVEFMFEKRAILFDVGDLSELSRRKLLRINDVFVSHMHLDHFCGFDQLLRVFLGRERTLRIFGPPGVVEAVEHKLAAYTWNLVESYQNELALVVSEFGPDDCLRTVDFRCRSRFRPEAERVEMLGSRPLLSEPSFHVRAVPLDHGGIPCLGFALQEQVHVNIRKNRLEQLGLRVGPWLRDFKDAVVRDAPDDTPIHVQSGEDGLATECVIPLAQLRHEIAETTAGIRLVYIVDASPTDANLEKIATIANGATALFIEATFLHDDLERARDRHHLTARIAGEIARQANVGRLVTLHFSPRYEGEGQKLEDEAIAAFRTAVAKN